MKKDTKHEAFEAAYRENYPVTCQINAKKFQRDGHEYDDTTVAIAFKLFKAGRSALQREACAVPDSRRLHTDVVADDEPNVSLSKLYFWRAGWNAAALDVSVPDGIVGPLTSDQKTFLRSLYSNFNHIGMDAADDFIRSCSVAAYMNGITDGKYMAAKSSVPDDAAHAALAQTTPTQAPDGTQKCRHAWSNDTSGCVDLNGTCTKCGKSFQFHIHAECP